MTAQSATLPATGGATITGISGAAPATDTYPPCVLMAQNTGAGAHVVTVGYAQGPDGNAVTGKAVNIPAAGFNVIRLSGAYADVNGRIAVSVDGTAAEVKFFPIGA